MSERKITEQLRRNAVALISLFIAVTGLLYNTWRNEHSELNRNQRWASFEVLVMLSELQELVYISYYDPEQSDSSDFRRGWLKVLLIRDLSAVMSDPLPESADALHGVWDKNWKGLEARDRGSKERIELAIVDMRHFTLATLRSLD
jgi:hypothetical protein